MSYHPRYRGVRLDVMAEENGTKRRFNVEMQVKDVDDLPRRSRYYHDHLDMNLLDYIENPDISQPCDEDDVYVKALKGKIAAIKESRDWEAKFMVLKELMEQEFSEGRLEGQDRVNRLNEILSELNRVEDILKAAKDKEYQELLFKEFDL